MVEDSGISERRSKPNAAPWSLDGTCDVEDIEIAGVEVPDEDVDSKGEWIHVESSEGEDEKMDVDEEIHADEEGGLQQDLLVGMARARSEDERPTIWGMPTWGREEDRKEVRKGVRLVGMEEVSRHLC